MIRYEIMRENIPCEEFFRLMKDSFQERKDQGLNFTVLQYGLEDLKILLDVFPVVVAFDENPQTEEREYLGFQIVDIKGKEAKAGILAVSPKCKRTGIGSKIEELTQQFAIDEGCEYMSSNTSVNATSSVKWHLRNGYRIIELQSFPSTNYYSYIFRKQLVHNAKWSNPVYCKLHYWKSAIQCRMYHLENGEDRKSKWLDFYKWLRGVKCVINR